MDAELLNSEISSQDYNAELKSRVVNFQNWRIDKAHTLAPKFLKKIQEFTTNIDESSHEYLMSGHDPRRAPRQYPTNGVFDCDKQLCPHQIWSCNVFCKITPLNEWSSQMT